MGTLHAPPGPKGHLLGGNVREYARDPLGFLSRCVREYGDVVQLRFMGQPIYLLSDPGLIEYVLVENNRNFTKTRILKRNRRLLGEGLLTSEGEFWRRQRRLAQPAFHRKRVAAYGEVMAAFAERSLGAWRDGQTIDVHEEMMHLTLEIVAKCLFDADVGARATDVGRAMKVALEDFSSQRRLIRMPKSIPTPQNIRFEMAARRLDEIVTTIIEDRRKSEEDWGDLLSMLMLAEDESGERMTDKQLRDEVMTLFLAGHETTANALSWTFWLLSLNPKVEHELAEELTRVLGGRPPTTSDLPDLPCVERIVKESMRLYPPAWVVGREAIAECEVGGYRMPAGTTALMSQWVMHRDPRYHEDPERFDPDRWTAEYEKALPRFAYFPFGGGPRQCIGASFAMTEARLILAAVAQRFKMELAPGQRVEPYASITLRPEKGIRMTLVERSHQC
ncbi:MAG: cytochrome P450 [Actinomycetota bacterium]|nr:cytochrome P450 [Actinomycetota bacterium]